MFRQLLHYLGIDNPCASIDWRIDPALSYGLFECRGPGWKVTDAGRRYYYFVIDAWRQPPRLILLERGIRYARILAQVCAPQHLIQEAIDAQGASCKDKNYAVSADLCLWLEENLARRLDTCLLVVETSGFGNPQRKYGTPGIEPESPVFLGKYLIKLRSESTFLTDEDVDLLCRTYDFYECGRNPGGAWQGDFFGVAGKGSLLDRATGLVWQRGGTAWGFYRRIAAAVDEANRDRFAGRSTWRLPTLEEALSLLTPARGPNGLHTAQAFDTEQGFIYSADRRRPGGYWFVDLRQGKAFWAGGTFSGGFGRFCCTACTD